MYYCLVAPGFYLSETKTVNKLTEQNFFYAKVGFPPFLSIVSRLKQVNWLNPKTISSHLFTTRSIYDLLASPQSTVQMVLEILIGWFDENDFVPQLVSSSLFIYSVTLHTQQLSRYHFTVFFL